MCHSVTRDPHDHSVQLNRWFLTPIGAWPRSTAISKNERTASHALIFVCSSLMASTIVPCLLYIIFEERDFELRLRGVGPLSHWIMGAINYCSLLLRNADIRQCVQHMQTDWGIVKHVRDREIMERNARMGRAVAGFCAIFMHGGVVCYSIVSRMTKIVVLMDNHSISTLLLPCPFYNKIVDTRFSPGNEIIMTIQMMSVFVVNSVTVGACSLAAVFAMHACGQLDILTSRLDKLVDGKDYEKNTESLQRKLVEIVDRHLRVLRFIARIENLMNQICLVELIGCTFNLCMIGYYSITCWDRIDVTGMVAYVIVYISMCFNIFIFCYIGEILTQQCKKIGDTAYMTDWYYLPHKTALGLVLIISRSSVVIKITAGKMIQLSIATFSDVIKTSLVYLNMLRTVTA